MKKKILLVGGDHRTPYIATLLQNKRFDVLLYGMEQYKNLPIQLHLTRFLTSADAFILPIPVTKDNKTVNAPFSVAPIYLEDLYKHCRSGCKLFAGNLPEDMVAKLQENGIECYDYGKTKDFANKNALPTAEGAIELLMKHTPYVLEGASVCVVGYGKIGKVLAYKLKQLGCLVTVTARREEHLNEIAQKGYSPLKTQDLYTAPPFHCIVNTVPAPVIDCKVLNHQPVNCLLLDLASVPGGINFAYAKEKGFTVLHALSLPAKHAPLTAAQIITNAILENLEETE